jgi:hypothetical protein
MVMSSIVWAIDAVWSPMFQPALMPESNSPWHPIDQTEQRILGLGNLPLLAGMRLVLSLLAATGLFAGQVLELLLLPALAVLWSR